jgi:hypothetical protein
MKAMSVPLGVVSAVVLLLAAMSLQAAEKGGLLVEISKKVVGRNDRVTIHGVGNMSIDHDVTLKLDIKNTSNKEFPQTPVESIVLVERWGFSESAVVERYTGTAKIDALHPAQNTSVDVGQFHIGGHMHGSSDMHVDKVVGWKVTLTRDGQKLEFTSSASFDTMDRRAKPATDAPRQPQ